MVTITLSWIDILPSLISPTHQPKLQTILHDKMLSYLLPMHHQYDTTYDPTHSHHNDCYIIQNISLQLSCTK